MSRHKSARSRLPRFDSRSGKASICSAWAWVSQLPVRVPWRLAPFTRPIAAAASGEKTPLSAASFASFLIALSRMLMEEGAPGLPAREPNGSAGRSP